MLSVRQPGAETAQLESAEESISTAALTPQPTSQFEINSSNICYGSLHNIWCGVNAEPLMTFPSLVQPRVSGTVKKHQLNFNVPATNGIWSTFQLVDLKSDKKEACGWFACHASVNPEKEIDRILRVSGSPYEIDSGSSLNNGDTLDAGILVINRYDWCFHDERGKDCFPDEDDTFSTVGIVDRAHAKSEIESWKDYPARERKPSKSGSWLYIPHAEYIFGRFGFDNAKTNAQSFLIFTGTTYFTRTAFQGLNIALRKDETHEERFERQLREGFDFSGVKVLKEMTRPSPFPVSQAYKYEPPSRDQWLGPYEVAYHLLQPSDIDALRLYTHVIEIPEQEMGRVADLINEVVMTYLDRYVVAHCFGRTMDQAATAMFPSYSDAVYPRTLVFHLQRHFMNASTDPPVGCGYDFERVNSRIRAFLNSRLDLGNIEVVKHDAHSSPLVLNELCTAGLNRIVTFLVTEMMEEAQNSAKDSYRDRMVPADFRITIFNDRELLELFQYSKVYWEGK